MQILSYLKEMLLVKQEKKKQFSSKLIKAHKKRKHFDMCLTFKKRKRKQYTFTRH